MGMEKYELFVRQAKSTLVYEPGWSADNHTGSWRALRPVLDPTLCNACGLCWLYCPDSCVDRSDFAIDLTYCKGCGICAQECKREAIQMIREAL